MWLPVEGAGFDATQLPMIALSAEWMVGQVLPKYKMQSHWYDRLGSQTWTVAVAVEGSSKKVMIQGFEG